MHWCRLHPSKHDGLSVVHHALIAALLALLVACSSGNSEQCYAFGAACADGGTVEQCCTPTACRYKTSDGTNFPCDGTVCTGASIMVRTWCEGR
jgi:hypothetical protein